jgi:AcrR family transcriptional regulator
MTITLPAPTRRARPGRRERHKHRTRVELIAAGRRLFAERGLYEARIEDLTTAAGIAKGTIYGYFEGKEELALAVVTLGFQDLQRLVRSRVGGMGLPARRIARIVGAHGEFFARNPDLLRVFHQLRGVLKFDRPEWRPLRGALTGHLAVLAELLHDGGRAGATRATAARQARALFGAISGILSLHVALRPALRRPVLTRAFVRAIVLLTLSLASRASARAATARPGEGRMGA